MSTSEQRKQWAAHMADEDRARQLQQQSAGASHTPTEGPLPYSAQQLEAAVNAAVASERQRCADIADAWSVETKLMEAFGDFTEWELRAASATARAVGGDIRAGAVHRA